MGNKKIAGVVMLAAGLIILVLSLLADPIWKESTAGFGTVQIVGTIGGAILTAVSLLLIFKK